VPLEADSSVLDIPEAHGETAAHNGAAARHAQDAGERQEQLEELMASVDALPEDYREVILLYYYDDVTYRDLSQMLGVSTATINARLTKARAMLRARMAESRR
jgi:RNA polymerase sigma-70 factor (ECF subfamily)